MNSPLRVVVCDNDENRVKDWKANIEAVCESGTRVTALQPAVFAAAVRALNQRVQIAKARGSFAGDEATAFDDADVLVLDSDLTPDPDSSTGEDPDGLVNKYLIGGIGKSVAELARTHSRVGAIVVVNERFRSRTFDLTMTRWAGSIAEAYISHEDVGNEGLWRGRSDTFRPWAWPVLERVATTIDALVPIINLDAPLLETLGLQEAVDGPLLEAQLEALVDNVDEPHSLLIRDVLESSSFGGGFRHVKGYEGIDESRLALWGVRRWLDRVVLPPQNVLIDLPHLLQDRPWLATDRRGNWNDTESLWGAPWGRRSRRRHRV